MAEEQKSFLEVTNIVKSFPAEEGGFLSSLFGGGTRVPALNGVSFTLEEGETLGLIGESGSGKSVLAQIIAGQEKPDKGKVVFMGKTISAMSEAELKTIRRTLRYIPEDAFSGLTADPKNRVDRLLFDLADKYKSAGGGGRSFASEMLERVGLGSRYLERFPHQMSGGEKQRLAIARALMLQPRLVVADEAVSNLDLNTRTEVLNLMKRLGREYRISFIFISNNPSMVRFFVGHQGRIAIMFAGRIMEILPGRILFDRATHPYTKSLLTASYAPSPLPGGALDPGLALSEQERVDAHGLELETLEAELSAEGSISASAQLAAASRPGCPFYRWCPEHFDRCTQETPRLLPVTRKRENGQAVPLAGDEREPHHQAACLWYIDQ